MQRDSTRLRLGEHHQLPLIPNAKIVSKPINLEYVGVLKSTKQALEYACLLADVVPKEVYPHMGCDKTTWSRICSGEWDLDGRDILKFSRVVNNDAYLLHLVSIHGYDLASLRKVFANETERENADLKRENAELRSALKYVLNGAKG